MRCHPKQLKNTKRLVYLNMSGTLHYSENEHTADHVQAASCSPMIFSVLTASSQTGKIY